MTQDKDRLDTFDEVWSLGDPAKVEKRFGELIPAAEAEPEKSTYLQILTQIALAKAIQKQFSDAHQTLDIAQQQLGAENEIAGVRLLLERGRVHHQAGELEEARPYYEQASERGAAIGCDYLAIDAAHMVAIICPEVEDKIHWNQLAIDRACQTKDDRARKWMGSLYNNRGQFLHEAKKYEESSVAYKQALAFREREADEVNIRVAKWAVARSLRYLGREDESITILHDLVDEYSKATESGSSGIPAEMLTLVRGIVFEELAEIYSAKGRGFALRAVEDLSKNEMFLATEPKRLDRLRQLTLNPGS